MRQFIVLAVLAAALGICVPAMAQDKNAHVIVGDEPRSVEAEKDVIEVRSLAEQTVRALEAGDTNLIGGYLANDYFCVDVAGNSIDKSARLAQIKQAGLKFTSVSTEQQSIRSYGTTMIVTGLLDVKGSMADRDISGRYRYLDVWIKRGGKWLAVASTMTRVPAAAQQAPSAN